MKGCTFVSFVQYAHKTVGYKGVWHKPTFLCMIQLFVLPQHARCHDELVSSALKWLLRLTAPTMLLLSGSLPRITMFPCYHVTLTERTSISHHTQEPLQMPPSHRFAPSSISGHLQSETSGGLPRFGSSLLVITQETSHSVSWRRSQHRLSVPPPQLGLASVGRSMWHLTRTIAQASRLPHDDRTPTSTKDEQNGCRQRLEGYLSCQQRLALAVA